MAITTTPIINLPLAIAVSGGEFLVVDAPNGDGTYTTRRLAITNLTSALGFSLLKSQVIAATQLEFLTIGGANFDAFIATQVNDASSTDGTYVAYWHHPYAPVGGRLYAMIVAYLTGLGLTTLQVSVHMANIYAAAPFIVAG